MQKDYICYFQKEREGATIKDSLADFGFAVQESKWPDLEIKDLPSRSWPEDDGDDVYIPSKLPLKTSDLEITLIYWGEIGTSQGAYQSLLNYLTGLDGMEAALMFYDTYNRRGNCGMYLKKIGDITHKKSNIDEVLIMRLTLHIPNPANECKLVIASNGIAQRLAKI